MRPWLAHLEGLRDAGVDLVQSVRKHGSRGNQRRRQRRHGGRPPERVGKRGYRPVGQNLSEWLPLIFNEQEARYSTLEEANMILGHIMTLYHDINAAILEERVVLPGDCRLHPQVLDNLEDSAPLARWSRGFLLGHEWLEELWSVELPGDLDDEELGAVLLTLSFFSSRNLAEAFHEETAAKTASLEAFAESILRLFPDALAEYAHFGRSVLGGVGETTASAPKRVSRTGRNDPCPCGSGKKFKKCCGETRH
ncbi:MAG: hypothetical protein DMF89_03095 [Acidobacteria bacterium]|nr:MAG: hypothetical protein DMF89_03095 [Acidobacteriota bacterium]